MDAPLYILDIDPNDPESGVDAIGLVQTPAIERNWRAFSKQSYTDYPESASNNAKKALEWADKNGWGSCGTDVGKQRANQLAKREPISEETIARMAAFERHRQNKDVPYSEGCGGLMWDAWGGTSGIEWAQSKLRQIRGDKFQEVDKPKQILAGPLMVADKPIYRRDEDGTEYYVQFTAQAIAKIVEKIKSNNERISFNLDHNPKNKVEAFLMGDFIIDSKMGINTPEGFEPLPDGSWFGFVKIPDKKKYEEALNGRYGFSVEGYFKEKLITKKIDMKTELKTLFTSISNLLGFEEEVKEEVVEETTFEKATLEDGTVIQWEGEIAEGTAVMVVPEEGDPIPAPDGTHTLTTGVKVTTENGLVTSIEAAEEMAAVEPEPEPEPIVAVTEQEFASLKDQVAELVDANKKMFEAMKHLAEAQTYKAPIEQDTPMFTGNAQAIYQKLSKNKK